jgi:hypothetical protein
MWTRISFFAGCIYILVCIIINNYILSSLYYAIIVLYSTADKFSRFTNTVYTPDDGHGGTKHVGRINFQYIYLYLISF